MVIPQVVRPLRPKLARGLAQQLTVPPRSKPVISYGPAGRSSVSGHVATVFGCTGFLGRYLVSKLAKAGTQVIVPFRDEDEKRHLKVMGDLGQVVPLMWDIRDPDTIAECVRHSDVVYNLVGREYETKNFTFEDVNITGAQLIAEVSRASSVSNFIHVSHLNANVNSISKFYATKAAGEEAVKAAFPNAVIVRPGPYYGHEDKLLNSMAFYPILWTLNDAKTKLRPVHVLDVAQALSNLVGAKGASESVTFNLPGPTVHSYASLLNLIQSVTYNSIGFAPTIPKSVMLTASKVAQAAWWPLLSPDEVERRYIDDIGTDAKGEHWQGDWDKFGITPEEVENLAITYLRRYRTAVNFSRPVVLPSTRGTPATFVASEMGETPETPVTCNILPNAPTRCCVSKATEVTSEAVIGVFEPFVGDSPWLILAMGQNVGIGVSDIKVGVILVVLESEFDIPLVSTKKRMPRLSFSLAVVAAAAAFFGNVAAQSGPWAQCGGQTWTGPTTCVNGWTCVYSNPYYSQCLQGTSTTGATTSTTTTTSKTSTTTSSSKTSTTSGTTSSSKTSSTTTTATTTGTAVTPITTLVSGWLWIRAVEAPNFHKYLQSYNSYAPGDAILGDYTTAAQFNIVNGQLEHYLPNGSLLYLQVEQPADSTVVKLKTSFATTPNTFGTFVFSGDAVTWSVPSITRPNNAAWLACTDAVEGALLYINLGPYAYNTPAGCADETIHYYNDSHAVPRH